MAEERSNELEVKLTTLFNLENREVFFKVEENWTVPQRWIGNAKRYSIWVLGFLKEPEHKKKSRDS